MTAMPIEPTDEAAENQEILNLRKMIDDLNDSITLMSKGLDEFKVMREEIKAGREDARQAYMKAITELDRKAAKIEHDFDKRQRDIDAIAKDKEAAANKLQAIIDARIAQERYDATLARWDRLTKSALWREWAKEHQLIAGRKMVLNRRMVLADKVGLGKTLSSIIATDMIKAGTAEGDFWTEPNRYGGEQEFNGPPAGRKVLYLSPAELVRNVEPEWKHWRNTKTVVLAKKNKLQRRMMLDVLKDMDEFVVQCNYEAWRKDMAFLEELISLGFDTVILDEAHVLKDRDSIAYRGVRLILDGITRDGDAIADKPRFVFPMTGTPILNRPQELYSLLTLVDSTVYPNSKYGESQFLWNYCERDEDNPNRWKFKYGGLERLSKQIAARYLGRSAKDAGIVIPPQAIQYHEITVDEEKYPKQAEARREMRTKAILMLDRDNGNFKAASSVLEVYLRLRQIEVWPAGIMIRDGDGDVVAHFNVEESQKMDYIIDENGEGLLTEVCPDARTVIMSQFKPGLHVMHERALKAGLRSVIYDGDTPQKIRDIVKVDFDRNRCREDGREVQYDCAFINYKTGGTGLNFSDATQTIIVDEEWNPGKRDQAYGRTARMGQTEETTVHVIRMEHTIDNWLAALIDSKEEVVGGFEQAMDRQRAIEALRDGEI